MSTSHPPSDISCSFGNAASYCSSIPPIRFDRRRLDSHSHSCSHFYSHQDPPLSYCSGLGCSSTTQYDRPLNTHSLDNRIGPIQLTGEFRRFRSAVNRPYADLAAVTLKYTPQPPSALPSAGECCADALLLPSRIDCSAALSALSSMLFYYDLELSISTTR